MKFGRLLVRVMVPNLLCANSKTVNESHSEMFRCFKPSLLSSYIQPPSIASTISAQSPHLAAPSSSTRALPHLHISNMSIFDEPLISNIYFPAAGTMTPHIMILGSSGNRGAYSVVQPYQEPWRCCGTLSGLD